MLKSYASSLACLGSALLLAAVAPACGSSTNSGSGFTKGTGNNGNNNNNNGDDTSGDDGGSGQTGPVLSNNDSGAPPDFGDAGCANATATTSKQPVYIEFVLDGSGSMQQDNKWTAATGALNSIFGNMGTTNDPGVAAGLIVFSDTKNPTLNNLLAEGPYPTNVDVPIAQVDATQAAKLQARFAPPDSYSGGTPTGIALGVTGTNSTGGYGTVAAFTPTGTLAPGGKRVVVLITDGVPEGDLCDISGTNYTGNPCVTYAASELSSKQNRNLRHRRRRLPLCAAR